MFDAQPQLVACGKSLRKARKARHLSRAELSKRLGLSPSSIARSEDGEHFTSVATLLHWAHIVGVPMAVLFPDIVPTPLSKLMLILVTCPPQVHEAITDWIVEWVQMPPTSLTSILLPQKSAPIVDGKGA